MKIISPVAFDATKITTNVPITETVWAAGTCARGARRYVLPSYDLYEVVVDSTTDEPVAGAAKDVKTWALVGKVNAYACFDNVLENPTLATGGFDMTIAPSGAYINGIAMFNVFGAEVRITQIDPVYGVVYDEIFALRDVSNITDWRDIIFAEYISKPDFVALDLPFYLNSSIRIRVSGNAAVGEVVLGTVSELGQVKFGATAGIIDRSTKDTDVFGNTRVVPRGYSKRAAFTVRIPTKRVDYLLYTLAQRRAIPTVYVGSSEISSTLIYGYFKNAEAAVRGPIASEYVIEVEGLV